MQTKFRTTKYNFFNTYLNPVVKTYEIKADEVVFYTTFKQEKNNFTISIAMVVFNNLCQHRIIPKIVS